MSNKLITASKSNARGMIRHDLAEPMHTMLRRYEEIERNYPQTYRKPSYMPPGKVEAVAEAVASWDLSDPFAYDRTALYARQGYIDVDQTIIDYHQRVLARRAARALEVERLKVAADE